MVTLLTYLDRLNLATATQCPGCRGLTPRAECPSSTCRSCDSAKDHSTKEDPLDEAVSRQKDLTKRGSDKHGKRKGKLGKKKHRHDNYV